MLNNLLANSIKFTKPATAVRVSLETTEKTVTWKLQDAGPGIDAEIQETLFQTGVKGNADVPGHGIGLAIAKRIAEEHGGTLSAETPPGGGAIFSLTLPLIEPPQRSEDL